MMLLLLYLCMVMQEMKERGREYPTVCWIAVMERRNGEK